MTRRCLILLASAGVVSGAATVRPSGAQGARDRQHWIGTWATAAQPAPPTDAQVFQNQTVRLIVHTSAPGKALRIKISNVFGNLPVQIGSAHVARRAAGADIDPATDRSVRFSRRTAVTVPPRSAVVSDPVDLDVPPLSDVAVSLFFPEKAVATTSHSLALQTSYISSGAGDATGAAKLGVAKTIASWPFLTGVDVGASSQGASIVAFGSSTTDGDGSTRDANRRWPDVLAERLQHGAAGAELGILNEGIIGNRLLYDSPRQPNNPFGPMLGEAGLTRFERDVLNQSGVKYLFVCLGVNDILFPEFPFTPSSETVTAADIIAGYRELVARAHERGIRVIGTTIPPFEGATFTAAGLNISSFYTPERERTRAAVNEWIRHGGGFDDVADFDEAVRDAAQPTRLLPAYAARDRLHVNDAGNVAQGNAVPLALFQRH